MDRLGIKFAQSKFPYMMVMCQNTQGDATYHREQSGGEYKRGGVDCYKLETDNFEFLFCQTNMSQIVERPDNSLESQGGQLYPTMQGSLIRLSKLVYICGVPI